MRFFREVFFAVAWPVSRRAACLCLLGALAVLPLGAADPAVEEPPQKPSPEAVEAVEALKLPGLTINLEEKSVDVDATVCLRTGFLELVACTKGSKEHESIISVDAKPSHIHAALLLLGAKPGNPAMRKPLNEEMTGWVDLPPRGGQGRGLPCLCLGRWRAQGLSDQQVHFPEQRGCGGGRGG